MLYGGFPKKTMEKNIENSPSRLYSVFSNYKDLVWKARGFVYKIIEFSNEFKINVKYTAHNILHWHLGM